MGPRRVFKTFSEKNSKKIKIFKFVKKFRTTFFQQFLQFFEVCSSGNLVNCSEVCSRGVLEEISLLSHQYPSRVHPSGVPERSEASIDGWVMDGWMDGWTGGQP